MGPDEVAAELYVLAPGEFVERRDAMARELREAGDRTLAADVKKWRRPLVTAWVVNLLAWYRPDELDTLLALGDELLAAQRDRDATAIRNLTDRRQRLVRSLVKQGLELAEEAGQPVGPAAGYEVESTLNAALAEPAIAERVRSGRLERPESYAGFGPLAGPSLHIVPEPGAAPARRAGGAQAPATRTSTTRASATGAPAASRTPAKAVPPSARPGKAAQGGAAPGESAGDGAARGKAAPDGGPGRQAPGQGARERLAELPTEVVETATQRRAAERRAAERARAEQAAERAQAALAAAEERHDAARSAVDDAEDARRELEERAEELRAELGAVDRRLTEADLDLRRLARAAERAEAAVDQARDRADSAERNAARHR